MGKSIVSAAKYQELSRVLSSTRAHKPKQTQLRFPNSVPTPPSAKSGAIQLQSHPSPLRMESRTPLSDVVADCTKRWFQETLKESKAGDSSMQLIVGQMYNCGYGVPRDPRKGHAWISKASKNRNSVWKASEKHPGYRASSSDSEEMENKAR